MPTSSEALARRQQLVEIGRLTEGITRGELATILRDASREAHAQVGRNLLRTGAGAEVRAGQFQAAMEGLDSLSASMWGEVGALTRQGVYQAADLAATQAVTRTRLLGMPRRTLTQYANGLTFSAAQSAEDIISRRTRGWTLSERIYRNGQATTMQVGKIVERGLAQQLSAREIAAKVKFLYAPDVPGGASYAARRLARTEINNAHHETTIRLTKDAPWVKAYQWTLSASHPQDDECDDLAEQDVDNLGPGLYKGSAPDKPHPQCLCFIEVVQAEREEFLDRLASGNYDSYLSNNGVIR